MFLTVASGDEDANSRYDCTVQRTGAVHSWSWNFSRPTLQDRGQDQDHKYQNQDLASQNQYQDQDRVKLVSSALETKTAVSRTTSLTILSLYNYFPKSKHWQHEVSLTVNVDRFSHSTVYYTVQCSKTVSSVLVVDIHVSATQNVGKN